MDSTQLIYKQSCIFDDILENRIGHGKAQVFLSSAYFLIWLCDGGESLVVAFVLPIMKIEWHLTDVQMSLVGSLIFLGWGIGALCSGQFSDRYGRKKTMIFACLIQFIFGFLSTFSFNYTQFLVLRGLFGFTNGLIFPLTSTYISEIIPKSRRGKFFVHICNAFPLGEILIVFFAILFFHSLEDGNWRALLFVSCLPGLGAYILAKKYVIESPRYQLCCTETNIDEIVENLNHMGKLNKESYQPLTNNEKVQLRVWAQESYNVQKKYVGDVKELFRGKNFELTIKLMIMWFSLSFVYYGVLFILPFMILKMRRAEGDYDNDLDAGSDNKPFDFFGIFLACFVEIPSNMLAFYTIENPKLGRKNSMFICYGICSICCIIAYFNTSLNAFFFILVGAIKFFINFSFCTIYPFTAEVYMTALRTTGIGLNNSICRFGGVLMPWVSLYLFQFGVTGPFLAFAIISAISCLSAFTVKKDTTNTDLDTYNDINEQEELTTFHI